MDKNIRIDEIVTRLNAASDAYYGGQGGPRTNYEGEGLFFYMLSCQTVSCLQRGHKVVTC